MAKKPKEKPAKEPEVEPEAALGVGFHPDVKPETEKPLTQGQKAHQAKIDRRAEIARLQRAEGQRTIPINLNCGNLRSADNAINLIKRALKANVSKPDTFKLELIGKKK